MRLISVHVWIAILVAAKNSSGWNLSRANALYSSHHPSGTLFVKIAAGHVGLSGTARVIDAFFGENCLRATPPLVDNLKVHSAFTPFTPGRRTCLLTLVPTDRCRDSGYSARDPAECQAAMPAGLPWTPGCHARHRSQGIFCPYRLFGLADSDA